MSDFNSNEIRRLDGTLLLVFVGLMRTGKAADVAAQLGVTNSSVSHALARLRDIFGDDLFLRRPHGMEPTAFARQVEPDVRAALTALQAALSDNSPFDPASVELHLRLSARDSEIAATLPQLLSELRKTAPGITASVRSMTASATLTALRDAEIDLALGFFGRDLAGIDRHFLRKESYLVVARQGHPLFEGGLTLQRYLSAEHVLVSADGSLRGIVDSTLAEQGLARRVVLAVPQFLPTLAVISQSDAISTLPAALVRKYAPAFDLVYAPPPLAVRAFEISALTHIRDRRNQALQWCVERLVALHQAGID